MRTPSVLAGTYLRHSPAHAGCARGFCRAGCRGRGLAHRRSCTLCPCPCGSGGAWKWLRSVAVAHQFAIFPNAAGPLPVQTQAQQVMYNHYLTICTCRHAGLRKKYMEVLQLIIYLILKQQFSFENNLFNRKTFKCSNLCATNNSPCGTADKLRFVSNVYQEKALRLEHKLLTLLHTTNTKVIKQF